MNLDIFKPNNGDGAFLAYIKREASFHIEQIHDSPTKEHWYEYYKALMELVIAGKNSRAKNPYEFVSYIIESKDYLKYNIPLLPVNITKDDFEMIDNQVLWNHKRSLDLIWNSTHKLTDENSIYYKRAYKLQVRKTFDFIKREITETDYIESQYVIFISKGGVISGDFIDFVYIRTKDYEKGSLRLELPITIPVCEIYFEDKNDNKSLIYAVDHREPALKQLMEKYSCPICNNTDIASYKLNLRNCKNKERSRRDCTDITFSKPEVCKRGAYEAIEDNGAICLKSASGILAKWVDGHVTIYYNLVRYKKINNNYWIWFTGHSLINLKTIYNHGNKNISFIY